MVARSAAAAAAGVMIGQRRRQAQRRCPEIELVDHDPARDAREFEPVVRAVAEVSPRLDVIEPGWVSLAARGPAKYFGGDAAVAEHLQHVVAEVWGGGTRRCRCGRWAVLVERGGSIVGASMTVRWSSSQQQSPAFCAPLPIGWLQTLGESDPEMIDLFTRLGLRRLGDLASLDPADVLGRFGHPGVHAHRLAAGS